MSNPGKKKQKKIKPISKPYLRGNPISKLVVIRALKLMVYPIIFILLNLFVGAPLALDNLPFLRYLLNILLIVFCIALLYNNGQNTGYGDVTLAEIMYNHDQEGKTIFAQDRDRCFHPLKGFATALIAYLPLFILAVIFALTVKRQEFALPPLPSWVQSFQNQSDLMLPLQYYQTSEPVTAGTILLLIMRLMIYPYINLVGARNADLTLLMDRLSPLTLSLPFIGYAIGYMRGRYSRAMLHGNMAAADRKRRRKARKAVQRKPKSKTELV